MIGSVLKDWVQTSKEYRKVRPRRKSTKSRPRQTDHFRNSFQIEIEMLNFFLDKIFSLKYVMLVVVALFFLSTVKLHFWRHFINTYMIVNTLKIKQCYWVVDHKTKKSSCRSGNCWIKLKVLIEIEQIKYASDEWQTL